MKISIYANTLAYFQTILLISNLSWNFFVRIKTLAQTRILKPVTYVYLSIYTHW